MKLKLNKKTLIIVAVSLLAIGGGSALAYQQLVQEETKPETTISDTKDDTPNVSDETPTDEEKAALIERNNQRLNGEPNTGSPTTVAPVITSAMQSGDQVTVNSYVPGIVEDGGTCTMKAQKGSLTVTKNTSAFADATTTACPPFFIDKNEFNESGNWEVTVSYQSPKAQGISQTKALTIN